MPPGSDRSGAAVQRQVIYPNGPTPLLRWLYVGIGAVATVMGLWALAAGDRDGWLRLSFGVVWLAMGRVAFLKYVLTPEGMARERFFGGYEKVPWSRVTHLGHDTKSPQWRTGASIQVDGGSRRLVPGWAQEEVEQALQWWREATGRDDADSRD